ncbi:hypothetical protein CK203_110830 [Vitis vinifera]|uniref:Uncharacterized protein n=1 Tax=Vitis vinifera TaxID=29760 RepID=A0A438BPF6_VITVI|nr:hypothetical protein CK203_110830 [Vitis vinifera]
MVPIIDDTRLAEQKARVERLEFRMRQIKLQDGGLTWDDRDGILAASLPTKFCMPDIERYSGIGCPKIHLRLYSTVMRAHRIDDAQLVVALFLMSLSGAAQKCADIDVSRRELEATRQRPDEFISSFLSRWRAKMAGMIDQPKEQDQLDLERATTHPPPRPYAQRPARQFTPLGMTLTRAFKKLRDAGLIVPFAPRPLPHPIPTHFHSHEHCLYHQIQGHDTERCLALHHAIQDLIDLGLVNLVGPSVTTNPLPTHSTHAVPLPPSLQ